MRQVYLVVIQRCNLACRHCIRESSPLAHVAMGRDQACSVVDQVCDLYPTATLVITGGEPTLHPAIASILEHAGSKGRDVLLASNGTRPEFFSEHRRLLERLRVQLSVDGPAPLHDAIRGEGTFNKIIASLQVLGELGCETTISMTVSQDNLSGVFELYDWVRRQPVRRFKLSPEIGAGFAEQRHCRHVDLMRWNETARALKAIPWPDGRLICQTSFAFVGRKIPWYELGERDLASMGGCGSGSRKLYVNPNLDVIACPCLRSLPFGNLAERALVDIMRRRPDEPKRVVFDPASPCSDCEYFPLCKGGCPGESLRHFGRLGVGDPRCPRFAGFTELSCAGELT